MERRYLQNGAKLMKNFMAGLRLAFNFGFWNPLQSEWTFAAQCIQPEEKERISQFMFQKDAKAAMAGRLLIRKSLSSLLQVPYSSLVLSRTDKGKPYLSSVGNALSNTSPHFNIAHHGNFTVLATHPNVDIGVDVMKVEQPMGRTIKKFFHDMRRQFTELEWRVIQSAGSEFNQLLMFYRHWCLKESMVKCLGAGIGFGLDRLEFHVSSPLLTSGNTVTDTVLLLDGKINKEWTFEETLLEGDHCIAIAYQYLTPQNHLTAQETKTNHNEKESQQSLIEASTVKPFRILSFQELIANAMPQTPADLEYWQNFDSKLERPKKQQESVT
ncbi:L-aminoadipate-semialdehyde dehydrogenase-phosphopantetheinyl transferase-like isoform X2 [Octopus vulgaris]|uniref:L-aminoadipate-semialdehyde dehydrogenase-phosphopantetheinyl transferase n=2 Tax=Octopus vulgaris TaxID=6645 RepID=A0AA36FBW3_OCTVU|nr:L-aminoadipate-semialdehyde dehydrogenase-phosphopantetheinyl transferase-like isoform X2 [Octopus vulgaris]